MFFLHNVVLFFDIFRSQSRLACVLILVLLNKECKKVNQGLYNFKNPCYDKIPKSHIGGAYFENVLKTIFREGQYPALIQSADRGLGEALDFSVSSWVDFVFFPPEC